MASAVAWHGLWLSRIASPEAAREQAIQLRAFAGHAGFAIVAALGLLLLNGLTTPGPWWAIWPIWGLAIALGMHAGYLARGLFGLHAGLFVVINVGLFVIDAHLLRHTWFFIRCLDGDSCSSFTATPAAGSCIRPATAHARIRAASQPVASRPSGGDANFGCH